MVHHPSLLVLCVFSPPFFSVILSIILFISLFHDFLHSYFFLLAVFVVRSEFTIFGGLEESIRFIANYKFKKEECDALQRLFPHWEAGFLDYLLALDTSQVKVYAIREGTIVFPRIPLLRIEGPLGICQV